MSKKTALRRGAVIAAAAALVLSGTTLAAPPAEASTRPGPTLPSVCYSVSSTTQALRYGDRGWRVTYLQCVLRSMGYPTVAVDGVFGSNTRRAVVDFQYYIAGITADGIVGPVTWRHLHERSRTY